MVMRLRRKEMRSSMAPCVKDKTARICEKIHQVILILPVVLGLVGYPQKQNSLGKRIFWKKL
jgi:hypothetical protein